MVLMGGNKVLFLHNETLVNTITLEEKNEMFSIAATKKGFVVGGAGKTISIYDIDKSFNVVNSVTVGNKSTPNNNDERVTKIYVSSNDGIMTLTTNNQVGAFNFYLLNSFRLDAEVSSIEQFFPSGFHNKKVNQMSVSVTKQLLASCSEDNTVKIWNFFEH
jgi:WD40 repeat protein